MTTGRDITIRQDPAHAEGLPPILLGNDTQNVRDKVAGFYNAVAQIFERWVARMPSANTRRAYRHDVLSFCDFAGIAWPDDATRLFTVTVAEVLAFRDMLVEDDRAPKTINRRIASISSFYKYLQAAASELRLPITVPNPAHAQFIARGSSDPVDERKALSATRARQLMGLPSGDSILECRDRAILKCFLYSGARIGTICRLKVNDFHRDGDEATLKIHEKGDKHRVIGIHFHAAEAIAEYIQRSGISSGALFRARKGPTSDELSDRPMDVATMYRLVTGYLSRLPGAMQETETVGVDGVVTKEKSCIYTPHSIRATTATLLLDAGVDIRKVQELLGHRHVTTTQIYDKRRRGTKESASHDMPI